MGSRRSAVKVGADDAGIPVLQPDSARDPELLDRLRDLHPDVSVVVAYGKLLPSEILEVPPRGFVNVHFSLLPEYRGAAPVSRAIIDGRDETGVSLIVLTQGMDEGPVIAARSEPILPEDTAGSLGERLAVVGAELLAASLAAYVEGSLEPREQDHSRATYAPKISPDETRIDWSKPASSIRNLVRGLEPDPGAWTTFRERRLRVRECVVARDNDLPPGRLVADDSRLLVGTGRDALELVLVQPAGKRPMSGAEFARGARLKPHDGFGLIENPLA